jgi:DNA invertase Pin-like site-specific DNA recombinase
VTEASKITTHHLKRNAYVYVRQSTVTQVREHTESLERQYELVERAQSLGWASHQVIVIDCDLGRSGTQTTGREGFKGLVADVGLGSAGVVLGIEVSRLARNNADWYHLLDLCALTDTLIADQDGVYHPADFNDRLVLGLKGTMSEAELHLIRGRLTAGLRHKAAKGELRQGLPVGYDYDADGNVVMSANEAVVSSIAEVFARFEELGSARQVMLSLRDDGLLIPRRRTGSSRITWDRPTYPAIHDFLTNPAYAGAFVFGRTRTEKRVTNDGRVAARVVMLPRDEWAIVIPDHHPGFIAWDAYEAVQDKLRANWRPPRGHGGGAVREGAALLQGLLRCGHCGRMMQTGYSGNKGNCPRYVCARAQQLYGAESACQSLGGQRLEQRVLGEVFKVLEPAALEATVKALEEAHAHHHQRLAAFELAVERARFESERARRQFDLCEPENRLVARTLERAWEDKLAALRRAESELAAQRARRPVSLTEEELSWARRAGADVRGVFEAPTTTFRERKQLLRAVISEVVVTVNKEERVADVSIIWEGGAATRFSMALNKTGGHFRATDEDTVALVRRLAVHYDDRTIAVILSRQRRRTATGLPFTKTRVTSLRHTYDIPRCSPPVIATEEGAAIMTAEQVADEFGVDKTTVYRWLRDGFIVGEQLTPTAPWQIRVDNELRAKICEDEPEGWLRLDDAARALGVARQTVLHRVQCGELKAVFVHKGKRKGLRIEVKRDHAGLFASRE